MHWFCCIFCFLRSYHNFVQLQIIAVHIDNGFLRKNESDSVEQSLVRLGLKIKGAGLLILTDFTDDVI